MSDFILEDFDLLFEDGDLVVADAELQHQRMIVSTNKGDWRQFPLVGCNLAEFLGAPWSLLQKTAIERRIRLQLHNDGYSDIQVDAADFSTFQISATR